MTFNVVPSSCVYEFSRAPRGRPFDVPAGLPARSAGPSRTPQGKPTEQPRPSPSASEKAWAEARVELAKSRFDAFTDGPMATMRKEMAQRAARQSLSRAGAAEETCSSVPLVQRVPSILLPIEEEKSHSGGSSGWPQDVSQPVRSQSLARVTGGGLGVVEERKQSTMATISTVLHDDEIAQLKLYHDNSLAASTRRVYQSDYHSFVHFLRERFPRLPIENMQRQCTLEHVLAYLNDLCNEGKKISTINRRLSTIKKHILPTLFNRALVPGSCDEQIMREVEAIVRGIRRTVGAEQRIRGKRPLLIEDIRKMVDVAAEVTDGDGEPMPNKRCRDVALLLFMFHSAMRRSEVASLMWSDLTFDKRGVVVVIRKSKTDQECKSQPIALPRLEHSYCPVAALETWKAKSRGDGDSPVFR